MLLGWATAAAAALAVLYGLYPEANGHPLSQSVAAFYASMHRTVWGAAIGWVIFACVTGYGGKNIGLGTIVRLYHLLNKNFALVDQQAATTEFVASC